MLLLRGEQYGIPARTCQNAGVQTSSDSPQRWNKIWPVLLSWCKELQGARKNKNLTETLAPIIHSVFHNSVKNEVTERATTILVCNILAGGEWPGADAIFLTERFLLFHPPSWLGGKAAASGAGQRLRRTTSLCRVINCDMHCIAKMLRSWQVLLLDGFTRHEAHVRTANGFADRLCVVRRSHHSSATSDTA